MLNLNLNTTSVSRGPVGPAPYPKPVVDFSASTTGPTAGDAVIFTDLSTNTPTSWQWEFPGGTPTGSTSQNPSVTYSATGSYNVTLYAGNTGGTGSLTKTNYINVQPAPPIVEEIFTSNGTWSCCSGATCIEVIAIGGGGGGAAGGATNSVLNDRGVVGGAGGGGGAVVIATILAGDLTSTVPVTIGTAGSGGAGVSPNNTGNIGTDGGSTCFGTYLNSGGGKTPTDGGYINVVRGGINSCAGVGGVGTITTGTGTVCNGGNGGGMNATNETSINGGSAQNVDGTTRTPGGGAGGSMWYLSGVTYCGNGGVGRGPNTVCDLQLGASGRGGNAPGGVGILSQGYGAGGAGGAANRNATSGSGRAGRPGVLKVIQYFS